MEPMEQTKTRGKLMQTAGILITLILFYAALWVLRREVKFSHTDEVLRYLRQIPFQQFSLAFLAAMGSYFALTLYDLIGLRHTGKTLPYGKAALTSFIAYAFSHNIGGSVLTGGGIRYRLYSAWGLTAGETAKVILLCAMTFWVGFFTMGSVFFFLQPPELPPSIHLPFNSVFSTGVLCLILIAAYLCLSILMKKNLRLGKWEFPKPSLSFALSQMAAGSLDWICSGTALYLLLPPNSLSLPSFMAIYLVAQIAGFASQVPGGLGILEVVVTVLLAPVLHSSDVLGAMLAFRLVYYLIPFILALVTFATVEIIRNKQGFTRALQILNRWVPDFGPPVIGFMTFLAGALLLFNNVVPEHPRHMVLLGELVQLSVIEISHFMIGLLGAALLLTARGLQKRLEGSHKAALILTGLGVVGCILKGFDYQQSLYLLVLFLFLLSTQPLFPRKSSLVQQKFPPFWIAAILFVLLGSIWVGVFSYHILDYYTIDLWSSFDLALDSARFLRSTLGTSLVLIIFSISALLSTTQPETDLPGEKTLDRVKEILLETPRASSYLALTGDKAILFNKKEDAFLMYAIEGKCWVTLGDPVGTEKEREDLALRFKDMCRKKNAWSIFYLVHQDHFNFYLDMGLTVLKVAEAARVDLEKFSLENLTGTELRGAYQNFKSKEEFAFEVLEPPYDDALMAQLKIVSENWLTIRKTREKGFSTGFFNPSYIRRFPLALVREEGRITAFACLRMAPTAGEAAFDLLRSDSEQRAQLEDYLTMESMAWAKQKGMKWFHLGHASLPNPAQGALAPFERWIPGLLSPHSKDDHALEARRKRDRYNPEWMPRYLAAPSEVPLSVVFANIHALISRWGQMG
jgi:phosphatidylglycerol lysyltransferase